MMIISDDIVDEFKQYREDDKKVIPDSDFGHMYRVWKGAHRLSLFVGESILAGGDVQTRCQPRR